MELRGKSSAADSSKQLGLVVHSLRVPDLRVQSGASAETVQSSHVLAWMQGGPCEQAHKLQDLVACTAFRLRPIAT